MPEESRSRSTPRFGGMMSVDDPLTFTENLEALKIENPSRISSKLLKELFLIPKFRKSPTRVMVLGSL